MKIQELLGVKKFADKTANDVIRYMDQTGKFLRNLEKGANAVALTDGTDVYKFWYFDSAYEKFIRYAIANQSNPLMPRVKSKIKKLPAFFLRDRNAPDYVQYIKLEMLAPVENPHDVKFRIFADLEITINFNDLQEILADNVDEKVYMARIYSYAISLDPEKYPNIRRTHGPSDISKDIVNLVKTYIDISELIDGETDFMDLHSGNIMLRGDQLVILDPIANTLDIDLNDKIFRYKASLDIGKAAHRPSLDQKARKSIGNQS